MFERSNLTINKLIEKLSVFFNTYGRNHRQDGALLSIPHQVPSRWSFGTVAILVLKTLLLVSLCLLAASTYLTNLRITLFSNTSLVLLLLWWFCGQGVAGRSIPRTVIILSLLFFCSLYISYLLSQNRGYGYFEYKHVKFILVGGLLYTAVLPHRFREIIILVLFSAAALDGVVGILQYFDLITAIPAVYTMLQNLGYQYSEHLRPSGFTLVATTYAAKLAFALGCAVLLLSHDRRGFLVTKKGSFFLMMVVILLAGGMIVSHSRGPLLAFIISVSITLFFHNWKKALVFCAVSLIIIITIVSMSRTVRERMWSPDMIASISQPRDSGGIRLELWKGAYKLFQRSPIFGVGSGDFERSIIQLINDKELQEIPNVSHAHNLYFQTMATQGLTGLLILIALLVALIRWGARDINNAGVWGGSVIIFCTFLMITEGLTDYYLGAMHYVTIMYLLIGIIGPYDNRVVSLNIHSEVGKVHC